MKVVILGDTHFGAGFSLGRVDPHSHLNTRLLDFSHTFDYVVDYMISNGVSHFIITGDVFEYRRPQASELSIFSQKIRRLMDLDIQTHIVIGNHDLIREQRMTSLDVLKSLKIPNLFIYSDIDAAVCTDGIESLNIVFFPFRTREMLDCSTNDEAVERLSQRLHYHVDKFNNKMPTIVVGHLMIQGTKIGNAVLEASPGEVVLPPNMFKGLNGVVMGHIHPHMIVRKRPFITYVGSMDCKDFGEANHKKHFLSIDVEDKKLKYIFEPLPVRPLYDLIVDQSNATNGKQATIGVQNFIKDFASEYDLEGSIIRLSVMVNDKCLFDFNKDIVRRFLRKKYNIFHCVGIYPQLTSKRQLRKSTITEHLSPLKSFSEYLELEDDKDMRENMRIFGTRIIRDRSKS